MLCGLRRQRFRHKRLKQGISDWTWSDMESHIYTVIPILWMGSSQILCGRCLVLGETSLRPKGHTYFLIPTLCFQFFVLLTEPDCMPCCMAQTLTTQHRPSETPVCWSVLKDFCLLRTFRCWWISSDKASLLLLYLFLQIYHKMPREIYLVPKVTSQPGFVHMLMIQDFPSFPW